MARLDRLGEAKAVAQTAAVLGREFSYGLLQGVASMPAPELDVALDRLVDAELMYARGFRPDARYVFKHALVQSAAYESLLKKRRRELHSKTARVLRERFPGSPGATRAAGAPSQRGVRSRRRGRRMAARGRARGRARRAERGDQSLSTRPRHADHARRLAGAHAARARRAARGRAVALVREGVGLFRGRAGERAGSRARRTTRRPRPGVFRSPWSRGRRLGRRRHARRRRAGGSVDRARRTYRRHLDASVGALLQGCGLLSPRRARGRTHAPRASDPR